MAVLTETKAAFTYAQRPGQQETDLVTENSTKNAHFLRQVREGASLSGGKLKERDVAVLRLRAQGYQNSEIGTMLSKSPKTIKNDLTKVFKNLGEDDTYGAIAWCLENGGIEPSHLVPDDYQERLATLTPRERSILDTTIDVRSSHRKAVGGVIFSVDRAIKKNFNSIRSKLNTKNALHSAAIHMAYTLLSTPENSTDGITEPTNPQQLLAISLSEDQETNAKFLRETHEAAIVSGGYLQEKDVALLRLRALGYQFDEISKILWYSPKTLRNAVTGVFDSLGVDDTYGAIAWCLENGVIKPSQLIPENYEARLTTLTPRERSILDTAVEIRNNHQRAIGGVIFIAEKTVKKHFLNILDKLNTRNSLHSAAIHMAYTLSQNSEQDLAHNAVTKRRQQTDLNAA